MNKRGWAIVVRLVRYTMVGVFRYNPELDREVV